MLKILSWNIRQGGGSRIQKIASKIIESKAQIVILSEFRNNKSGNSLISDLRRNGYKSFQSSALATNENGVLICSQMPFTPLCQDYQDLEFSENVQIADFGSIIVIGVYLPHKKKHTLFNILKSYCASNIPVVIAGDFNTGINKVDQAGTSFWYEDDFKKLLKSGFVDCYRYLHGEVKEYSWYSHQGNGYRYDHTLISQMISSMIISCDYIHGWREKGLSDHSPMLLEIG